MIELVTRLDRTKTTNLLIQKTGLSAYFQKGHFKETTIYSSILDLKIFNNHNNNFVLLLFAIYLFAFWL